MVRSIFYRVIVNVGSVDYRPREDLLQTVGDAVRVHGTNVFKHAHNREKSALVIPAATPPLPPELAHSPQPPGAPQCLWE